MGVACFGILQFGQILFKLFLLSFKIFYNNFPIFLKFFTSFFSLFCGGTLLLFVQHSLIHSHNFFHVLWGSVSLGRCAFFVFGQQQLNNCFWKIWVALRRAGAG